MDGDGGQVMKGFVLVGGKPKFRVYPSEDGEGYPVVIGGWMDGPLEVMYRINNRVRVLDDEGQYVKPGRLVELAMRQALSDMARFIIYEDPARKTPRYLVDTVLDGAQYDDIA